MNGAQILALGLLIFAIILIIILIIMIITRPNQKENLEAFKKLCVESGGTYVLRYKRPPGPNNWPYCKWADYESEAYYPPRDYKKKGFQFH